jgi:hypothetical protein
MVDPTKITTHVQEALDRLLSQYKDKEKINGNIAAFAEQAQPLENAFYDCITLRNIDAAVGEQLDGIGRIVGKERGGRNDAKYRIALYGKIGQNVSEGTPQHCISVFNLITESSYCHMMEHWPAEISFFSDTPPITGSQLLNDNDMEITGAGLWAPVNSAILTKSAVAPHGGLQSLRVAYNAVNNPAARQSVLTVNDWYWVNGYVKMENALGPLPLVKNGAVTIYTGFAYAGWYEFDIIFQATSTDIDFGSDHSAAGWVEYDDIEIYKLNYEDQQEILEVMELVASAGVKVVGIGWYEADEMFSFFEDPTGLGFGDALDPTVGGKFASLTATP